MSHPAAVGRNPRKPLVVHSSVLVVVGDASEVAIFEAVAVAFEGEDLGVVDQAVDHGCGASV